MKFKFKIQQYQTDAVESTVGIFTGQPSRDNFLYRRNLGKRATSTIVHEDEYAGYQIFTYVKNSDKYGSGDVEGMLLYARTQEEVAPDLDAVFGKNRIRVNTLDLNTEFEVIRLQLDNIVNSTFEN